MWRSLKIKLNHQFPCGTCLPLLHGDGQFLRGFGKMPSRTSCVFGRWPQRSRQPGSLMAYSIRRWLSTAESWCHRNSKERLRLPRFDENLKPHFSSPCCIKALPPKRCSLLKWHKLSTVQNHLSWQSLQAFKISFTFPSHLLQNNKQMFSISSHLSVLFPRKTGTYSPKELTVQSLFLWLRSAPMVEGKGYFRARWPQA